MKFPVANDVFERVAATFVEGALGVAILDKIGWVEITNPQWWTAVAAGGGVAVLALVKSWVFTKWGKPGASAASSVGLEPVRDNA
jgi:hypothetical protein